MFWIKYFVTDRADLNRLHVVDIYHGLISRSRLWSVRKYTVRLFKYCWMYTWCWKRDNVFLSWGIWTEEWKCLWRYLLWVCMLSKYKIILFTKTQTVFYLSLLIEKQQHIDSRRWEKKQMIRWHKGRLLHIRCFHSFHNDEYSELFTIYKHMLFDKTFFNTQTQISRCLILRWVQKVCLTKYVTYDFYNAQYLNYVVSSTVGESKENSNVLPRIWSARVIIY